MQTNLFYYAEHKKSKQFHSPGSVLHEKCYPIAFVYQVEFIKICTENLHMNIHIIEQHIRDNENATELTPRLGAASYVLLANMQGEEHVTTV